jgi:hypothetical protein
VGPARADPPALDRLAVRAFDDAFDEDRGRRFRLRLLRRSLESERRDADARGEQKRERAPLQRCGSSFHSSYTAAAALSRLT